MKRVFLALVLAIGLSGCATIQKLESYGSLLTASANNPVTVQMLYNAENGMVLAFAALNTYRRACVQGSVDVNCKSNIRAIQVYTRRLPPLLRDLRSFVKTNDKINAEIVYNTIVQLIADFKAAASARGVSVGG